MARVLRVVVVTGVGRYLGARVAARLAADRSVERVIGVDTVPARPELDGARLEFVRADIAHPLIATVLDQAGADTVVHIGRDATGAESLGLINACRDAPTLQRIVVASTTDVYGGGPRDPAVFDEHAPLAEARRSSGRSAVALEDSLRALARQRPDVAVTTLRLATPVGAGVDSWLTRLLAGPVAPSALGFDPRVQLLHEHDAVEALVHATRTARPRVPRVVNVAGSGVLALSQVLRLAGVPRVPVLAPLVSPRLRFAPVVDTTRLMRELGYRPRYTTLEALYAHLRTRRTSTALLGGRRPPPGRSSPMSGEDGVVIPLPGASARRPTPAGAGGGDVVEFTGAPPSVEQGAPGDGWQRRLADGLAFLRRRRDGHYELDDFGFDRDLADTVTLPAFRLLYEKYFRVEVNGIENVPRTGPALLVANHAGGLWPLDAAMTAVAVRAEHPDGRYLRPLGADLLFATPGAGTLARRSGATLACHADAERLLGAGELVGVWPEGFKGIGKRYRDRYRLQRFGRGGFVRCAISARAPIVPVSIVGSEEIHPVLADLTPLARLLGLPYFPVTPTFPWLGPLGLVPLPSKWYLEFGEPIGTDRLDAADPVTVFETTDLVRETIQTTLYRLLAQRRSVWR